MQNIPVDIGRLGSILCVVPAETRKTPEGQVRTDREGRVLYVIGLSVRQVGSRRADTIEVQLSEQPPGIMEGTRVIVTDLVARPWEIDGRSGISYRAASVAPSQVPNLSAAPAAPAAARGKSGGDA